MYEVKFPMSVRAIDIMERIRKVPGVIMTRVWFTNPGRKDETYRMKRIVQLVGPKVDFTGQAI